MKEMREIKEICSCDCKECVAGDCEKCSCKGCDCDGCECKKVFEPGYDELTIETSENAD